VFDATPTDKAKFLPFFQENFRIFQKILKWISKKYQIRVCSFKFELAKNVHAKFQLSSFYPERLRNFLTIFQVNIRIFLKNSLANLKKIQIWVCSLLLQLAKHVHAKFQFPSFYPDELRIFFDVFSSKFQDFSEELLSEFPKNTNLSMLFNATSNKACSCKISTL
jgi:hypothetical protein